MTNLPRTAALFHTAPGQALRQVRRKLYAHAKRLRPFAERTQLLLGNLRQLLFAQR